MGGFLPMIKTVIKEHNNCWSAIVTKETDFDDLIARLLVLARESNRDKKDMLLILSSLDIDYGKESNTGNSVVIADFDGFSESLKQIKEDMILERLERVSFRITISQDDIAKLSTSHEPPFNRAGQGWSD